MSRRSFRLSLALVLLLLAFAPLSSRAALPFSAVQARADGVTAWDCLQMWWDRFEASVRALRAPGTTGPEGARMGSTGWNKEGGSWDPNGAPRPASAPTLPAGETGGSWDPNGRP